MYLNKFAFWWKHLLKVKSWFIWEGNKALFHFLPSMLTLYSGRGGTIFLAVWIFSTNWIKKNIHFTKLDSLQDLDLQNNLALTQFISMYLLCNLSQSKIILLQQFCNITPRKIYFIAFVEQFIPKQHYMGNTPLGTI